VRLSSVELISVVIPTFQEAARLADLLRLIEQQNVMHEVIVVDGGSTDGTFEMARASVSQAISAPRGRGAQLKAGAEIARGDIILFLHADSNLEPGAFVQIRQSLTENPSAVGGNFRLLFDGETSFSRRLTRFYAWIRRHGFYYGDSAIFLRRSVYDQIGGIRAIALMEDYDLARRLERHGPTVCIDEPPIKTSSRKFEGRSSLSIIWGWLKIHALFYLGVSPDRLARMYYGDLAA
jgi:rSAM/selenodomain-associated transferase 2